MKPRFDPGLSPKDHLIETLEALALFVEHMPEAAFDMRPVAERRPELEWSAEAIRSVALAKMLAVDCRVIVARARMMARALRRGGSARGLWSSASPRVRLEEHYEHFGEQYATSASAPACGLKLIMWTPSPLSEQEKQVMRSAIAQITRSRLAT